MKITAVESIILSVPSSGGWFYPGAPAAIIAHFAGLSTGEDPRQIALLTRGLFSSCKYRARVGAAVNVISAIETAL